MFTAPTQIVEKDRTGYVHQGTEASHIYQICQPVKER